MLNSTPDYVVFISTISQNDSAIITQNQNLQILLNKLNHQILSPKPIESSALWAPREVSTKPQFYYALHLHIRGTLAIFKGNMRQ